MKIAALALLFISTALPLSAGTPAISIVEVSSQGKPNKIAAIRADDGATRGEILKLWKDLNNAFPKDRRNLFGPDSGFVAITITNGEEEVVVRSWHPLFERNPKVVVTSHGVEALEGRSRADVLKEDKAWYREARGVFDKIVRYTKTKAELAGAPNP